MNAILLLARNASTNMGPTALSVGFHSVPYMEKSLTGLFMSTIYSHFPGSEKITRLILSPTFDLPVRIVMQ